jgi:Protein of unknown function (DUF1559)
MGRNGPPQRRAFKMVDLLVVVGVIAILIGLLMPAVEKVREATDRAQSQNNLMQMGVGLHGAASNFNGQMPGAGTGFGATAAHVAYPVGGTVTGSLFFHLLPYIEQQTAYRDNSGNSTATTTVVKTYIAPLDRSIVPGTSSGSYLANSCGVLGSPGANLNESFNPKGTSNTFAIIEQACQGRAGTAIVGSWAGTSSHFDFTTFTSSPTPLANAVNTAPTAFSSGVAQALLYDGSVRNVSTSMSLGALRWGGDPALKTNPPADWW